MIPLRLEPEHAAALEAVRAERFGAGWRPGLDGLRPAPGRVVASEHPTHRGESRRGPMTRERFAEIVAARFAPGSIVSNRAAAAVTGVGIYAARRHVQGLRDAKAWPYRKGANRFAR